MHHVIEATQAALDVRRSALQEALGGRPALLAAGRSRPRAYAGQPYPFRAASHFRYLAGAAIEDAALLLTQEETRLFVRPPRPDDALWHGPEPTLDELGALLRCRVLPLSALDDALSDMRDAVMTVPTPDARGCAQVSAWLRRTVEPGVVSEVDAPLADALIQLI
ncbi:MAG: aminopeptidase P N-terminal domain-containing protein, partial [Myxococcota bacterium]